VPVALSVPTSLGQRDFSRSGQMGTDGSWAPGVKAEINAAQSWNLSSSLADIWRFEVQFNVIVHSPSLPFSLVGIVFIADDLTRFKQNGNGAINLARASIQVLQFMPTIRFESKTLILLSPNSSHCAQAAIASVHQVQSDQVVALDTFALQPLNRTGRLANKVANKVRRVHHSANVQAKAQQASNSLTRLPKLERGLSVTTGEFHFKEERG